jgi:hypothetical protein
MQLEKSGSSRFRAMLLLLNELHLCDLIVRAINRENETKNSLNQPT